jgi:transposase
VEDIVRLRQDGLSIQAISNLTGFDRKTIRKYLLKPVARPVYGPRPQPPSKLDAFKPFLKQRLDAGVWNAQVLLRELRERGYTGGYTILTDWLRPQRSEAHTVAVRRFETPPGKQAQADWGHLGAITADGGKQQMWGFAITLGYSRVIFAEAATDQKLGTLLRLHEAAFRHWGAVPEEILYDRMRTVWSGVDGRGEIEWNPVFLDFARYWGFTPRLCRPYRAQTKGKVESGVKYIRRNFLCGLQGREPAGIDELNAELRRWLAEVANQRVHGTTHQSVQSRWPEELAAMAAVNGRPPFPYAEDEIRRVARDAYVAWQGNRYSVPWQYAGRDVSIRAENGGVQVFCQAEPIARHTVAAGMHQVITNREHHRGIPLNASSHSGKTLIHIRESAPMVETRSLAAYEAVAGGAQ